MARFDLTLDAQQATLLLQDYPGRVSTALVRALNRGIASARTVMVRAIAQDTGLKSKEVRDALVMREASPGRPEASLAASLKRMPLVDFGARGPEPSRGKGRGVTYKLSNSRGRVDTAFLATMPSGHRGVFVRTAKARLGIRELKGPSLGHVFGKYRDVALARAQEMVVKNFAHEVEFASTSVGVTDAGAD